MSTSTPDPYEILGVAKDAQLPEIRSAHRKLVLKCHPDKVQDPTLKAQKQDEFQRVQTAYELLADEKARKRYDDQARLAELREQMRAKAAASASSRPSPSATASPSSSRPTPASTTYKYEIRTNDRTYKTDRQPSPVRGYSSYSRSYEDEHPRAADIFEGVRTVRREKSYQDKTTKREEREREKELERAREKEYARELREKERERERERRRRADEAIRRAEKENKEAEKEARRAEKKSRDKSRKRETEEKKRHKQPYIETLDGEPISSKSEKKKSSKKHDERRERDRSSHREEAPPTTSSMHPPPIPVEYQDKTNAALNYIQASRSKGSYASRHMVQPPAPTPPPVSSPFAAPADDDDARRSSAKPRRGSTGEKAYKPEVVDDPIEATPPTARPHMQKSATATGAPTTSPPRRTNTMPNEGYGRHVPGISRAQTFSGAYPEPDPRGRGRTRMQAQVPESDEEDEYERYRRERERKSHRSSKKHRSPESRGEHVMQYRVNEGGRTTLQNSYSRTTPAEEAYSYYPGQPGIRIVERPSMPSRDATYSAGYYPSKVKTSSYGDVQFSEYPAYRGEAYA